MYNSTINIYLYRFKTKVFFFTLLIILLASFTRGFKVTLVPPGLYIDEVAIGYNAYSIRETGRDEFGVSFPLFFRSFGDYKLPVYIYLTALSQSILGKTDLSVRLPSIIAGILTVWLLGKLVYALGGPVKLALLSSFLLAISPWHIQFSRVGFESNAAIFLVVLATYFMVKGLKEKSSGVWIGLFFYVLSFYTYHRERIFVPTTLIILPLLFWSTLRKLILDKKSIIIAAILFLLLLPYINYIRSSTGLARASSELFSTGLKPQWDSFFQSIWFTDLSQFLSNYLSYFSTDFLFFAGDTIGRHSVREIGQTYVWQLPFFLIGIFASLNRRQTLDKLFLLWLLLHPIAPSLARPNPHALRGEFLVIPLSYFVALGIIKFCKFGTAYKIKILSLSFVTVYFAMNYLNIYYFHYPKRTAPDWNSGFKEAVTAISEYEQKYPTIYLTNGFKIGREYLLYYGDMTPGDYLKETGGKGFSDNFGKYMYVQSPFNPKPEGKYLYLSPFWEDFQTKKLTTIYNRTGDGQFILWAN